MNLKINTMKFLQNKITNQKEIKDFIDNLASRHMLYHFEDDAKDIYTRDNKRAFTDEQCILLDQRTTEMLDVDADYAFEYTLETYLDN
jgi:hypothetical protein